MNDERHRNQQPPQAGFTLVETLVGALIFSILGLVLVQFIAVNAALLTASARQRDADAQATGGLNSIVAAKPADNTASLDWGDGKTVRLRTLVKGYYDYVVTPHGGEKELELPKGCNGWPCAVAPSDRPKGTDLLFIRAWTVSTTDPLRNFHQVRIGVFPGSTLQVSSAALPETAPPVTPGAVSNRAGQDAPIIGPLPPSVESAEALSAREGNVTFR
jgi:Tfp pilus assembly major pilin PilA